jgi:hypothetical protein
MYIYKVQDSFPSFLCKPNVSLRGLPQVAVLEKNNIQRRSAIFFFNAFSLQISLT